MKKILNKKRKYLSVLQRKIKKIECKNANLRKSEKRKKRNLKNKSIETLIDRVRKFRAKFRSGFYKPISYDQAPIDIELEKQLGIEDDFDGFIDVASSFIDSKSRTVQFDIENCTRLWPSAITLLCSFEQWTEITANQKHKPVVSSNDSNFQEVNSYLAHCGFYDYVHREHENLPTDIYDENQTVKIKREKNSSEIEDREDSIRQILEDYSILSDEQIEEFDDRVLIEAFNNVTEHGNSYRDNGWWTITQYHKTTGIISLCLADNGIGIKNSLLTGPQRKQLLKRFKSEDDSDYMCAALEENVSGAITGSRKDEGIAFLPKTYSRGSRRGNGLKRIKEACAKCGIEFSLLSQYGYIKIGSDGKIALKGIKTSRIFAGTLYHFSIPAKKINSEVDHEDN